MKTPIFFRVFTDLDSVSVHKYAKKEQYSAYLTEQAWSIKDLLHGIKKKNFLRDTASNPERARQRFFARSVCQFTTQVHLSQSCNQSYNNCIFQIPQSSHCFPSSSTNTSFTKIEDTFFISTQSIFNQVFKMIVRLQHTCRISASDKNYQDSFRFSFVIQIFKQQWGSHRNCSRRTRKQKVGRILLTDFTNQADHRPIQFTFRAILIPQKFCAHGQY